MWVTMGKSAVVLVVVLCFCSNSLGQIRYIPQCIPDVNRPDRVYSVGSKFTKTKPFNGKEGKTLTGTYDCECRPGGLSYCKATDIPCRDSSGAFVDDNERFSLTLRGEKLTCTCRRGRGRFDTCIGTNSPYRPFPTPRVPTVRPRPAATTCIDFRTRARVRSGTRYLVENQGRLYQCNCGENGWPDPGSCSSYQSARRTGIAISCSDQVSGAAVHAGEKFVVSSLFQGLQECDCGINGKHVPGTCAASTATTTSGVPVTAAPFNPCESQHRCHPNANCFNLGGGRYRCSCNPGYWGTGEYCTDVDECRGRRNARCDENASCTNTIGSFTCACEEGFTGDGFSCTSTDHCTDNLSECDYNARCISTADSFRCECNEGYEGDGRTCTELDRCAAQTECDVNAECTPTTNSFECHCLVGYMGDGRVCRKKCWDEIAMQFVPWGEVFLRLNAETGQQEGCTCTVGGVAQPGSCVGPEPTTTSSTTTNTTTTTAAAAATTTRSKVQCARTRGVLAMNVGDSFVRTFRRQRYRCTCNDRSGRGAVTCARV